MVTTKEPTTNKPPIIRFTVSASERIITEEITVTTGSNVETRDATDGPVISIPVKSAQKATTVETIAISITAISPFNCVGGSNPTNMLKIPYTTIAPSIINAED